jgi:tRNA(His) 5'-end guanylyltransferase
MKDLETRRRAREWFHGLTALPGTWIVIRVDGRYAYTESDEISVLLDPSFALFGRGVEKLRRTL